MAIDVLAEVLTVGQLGSKVICQPTLSRPWGLDFSTQRMSMLHFVLGGVCWVKPNKTSQAIRLMKGDVVFITNMSLRHSMSNFMIHYSVN